MKKTKPNGDTPKRLSFEKWVKTLELQTEIVICEECDGLAYNDCEECNGDGKVECDSCPGTGLIPDCVWCGHDGGYPDEYPGVESTGWVVCDHCFGDPNKRCECDSNGKKACEVHECINGKVQCEECEGDGTVIEYSPTSKEHSEGLIDLGVFLFGLHHPPLSMDELLGGYRMIIESENDLIKARREDGLADMFGAIIQ